MMPVCKEKLKMCSNNLKDQLLLRFKNNQINSYSDLLIIISDSLKLRLFTNDIVEVRNYEHVMLFAHYGPSHDDYIMTYVYDHHSTGESELNIILNSNKNEIEIVDQLLGQCELLLDHMINPYTNDINVFKNKSER